MSQRLRGDDRGFTVMELFIALGLLGVVLAAIYAASGAIMKGGTVNQTQAVFAKETGEGVRIVEKYLMQVVKIESAGDYSCTFLTDHNLDSLPERVRVTATSDGKLRLEVWRTNALQVNVSLASDTVFSEHVVNVARGMPLLTYYDTSGEVIADMNQVPTEARSVRLALLLSYNGSDHQATKTIFMRNMAR